MSERDNIIGGPCRMPGCHDVAGHSGPCPRPYIDDIASDIGDYAQAVTKVNTLGDALATIADLERQLEGAEAQAKLRGEALKGVWVIAKQRTGSSDLDLLLRQIQSHARAAIDAKPADALKREKERR